MAVALPGEIKIFSSDAKVRASCEISDYEYIRSMHALLDSRTLIVLPENKVNSTLNRNPQKFSAIACYQIPLENAAETTLGTMSEPLLNLRDEDTSETSSESDDADFPQLIRLWVKTLDDTKYGYELMLEDGFKLVISERSNPGKRIIWELAGETT
jgi:hypothetical protein